MQLPAQTVHLWQASLLQEPNCLTRLAQTLSPDEHARSQQFHFERDRRRYIIGRGILRDILARYLGQAANEITFAYGERGKPYLPADSPHAHIHFNLAHSHELAVYAIVHGLDVGVDLEYIHPIPDMEQIAERFFSASEVRALHALPEAQKIFGFFNCWTRKEAYIKATGDGLSKPLDQFAVSLAPGEPAHLLHIENDENEAQRWFMLALRLDQTNYTGALAIRNPAMAVENVAMFSWPGYRSPSRGIHP